MKKECVFRVSLLSLVLVGMAFAIALVTVIRMPSPQIDRTACPYPPNESCMFSVALTTSTNEKVCESLTRQTGSRCTSTCHASGAVTTCDSAGKCDAVDPTTCHGYCALPADALVEDNATSCAGKITFKSFAVPNTTDTSIYNYMVLHYADHPPQCHFDGGCRWFGTILSLTRTPTSSEYYLTSAFRTCDWYLNMTNSSCIRSQALPLDNTLSVAALEGFASTGYPIVHGTGCLYTSTCGLRNETALYENSKRSLASGIEEATATHARLVAEAMPEIRRLSPALVF